VSKTYQGDCLEVMDLLISQGVVVDAIITDIPYGTTKNKWDVIIPFAEMWERLNKLIKSNGAIVLFGNEPFSSTLRMSNIKNYKYDWLWVKSQAVGHLNAWRMPLKNTENVSVFYTKQVTYNPQLKDKPIKNIRTYTNRTKQSDCYGSHKLDTHKCPKNKTMPKTTITFNNAQGTVHPTQKPVLLMEELVKTYTNKGELVLDFTMGSGTTGVACKKLNRKFIGIELDKHYFRLARHRIRTTK